MAVFSKAPMLNPKMPKTFFTLFADFGREGGQAQRWPGESTRRTLPQMHVGESTHPGFATLSDPLCRNRQRG